MWNYEKIRENTGGKVCKTEVMLRLIEDEYNTLKEAEQKHSNNIFVSEKEEYAHGKSI